MIRRKISCSTRRNSIITAGAAVPLSKTLGTVKENKHTLNNLNQHQSRQNTQLHYRAT